MSQGVLSPIIGFIIMQDNKPISMNVTEIQPMLLAAEVNSKLII